MLVSELRAPVPVPAPAQIAFAGKSQSQSQSQAQAQEKEQEQGHVEVRRTYKICDFGVSRMLGDRNEQTRAITGGVGTGLYMAPEGTLYTSLRIVCCVLRVVC